MYVGVYPTNEPSSKKLKWVAMPTNIKTKIIAKGTPVGVSAISKFEVADLNDDLLDENLPRPWRVYKEQDLAIFAINNNKWWFFKGFVLKPHHCPGFAQDLRNGKNLPIVFTRQYYNSFEKSFIKNPTSGEWEEVWLDLKKVSKFSFKGEPLKTFKQEDS